MAREMFHRSIECSNSPQPLALSFPSSGLGTDAAKLQLGEVALMPPRDS